MWWLCLEYNFQATYENTIQTGDVNLKIFKLARVAISFYNEDKY